MSDIDLTEAVEAAAEGFCADLVPPVTLDNLSAIQRHVVREQALSYVTHALPHIERQVREQVAQRLQELLPGVLAATAHDAFGWLSDAQDAALAAGRFDAGSLVFHGEGSIDLLHVGEHAARIARGDQS